ncbi:MAG: glutathione S-transferase family protein [Gammaproteobacteria bacterium]
MTKSHDTMRLYTGPLSMFGAKAWIAVLEKGFDCDVVMVQFNQRTGYDPKHADVLRVNPKAQVPVLIHGDLELFDSTQLFEYFEDLQPQPPLWPTEIRMRARARNLELQSDEVFFPHVIRLMGLQDALGESAALAAREAIERYCVSMEHRLGVQPFLCGDMTYADIAFYMAELFAERLGAPLTTSTPRLLQWRERMSSRASVRTVLTPLIAYLRANKRPVPDFLQRVEKGNKTSSPTSQAIPRK